MWYMLEIKNVSKIYYGRKNYGKRALRGTDLTLPRGEIVGLFGENGAGKTTLMKCILNLLTYDGTITLDGEKITRRNIAKFSFATSEHTFFPNLTAKDHAEFYAAQFPAFSQKRFEALMDFFELPGRKMLRQCSTGQKNQFEAVMALSQGADYILMDEPFAGNDIFNREDFYKVLLGILEPTETVLISTHLIEEISGFIGRAVLLRKGLIIGDVSAEVIEESGQDLMEVIKSTYGYEANRVGKALNRLRDGE